MWFKRHEGLAMLNQEDWMMKGERCASLGTEPAKEAQQRLDLALVANPRSAERQGPRGSVSGLEIRKPAPHEKTGPTVA